MRSNFAKYIALLALLSAPSAIAGPVRIDGPLRPAPGLRLTFTCEGLAKLKLPDATISSATEITSGSFTTPTPPAPATTFTGLPHYCRVVGMATPTHNSTIGFEVWLPTAGYNGNYEQVGNGGFAGQVNYGGLADGIKRGYATASTDDGHQGFQDPSFAKGPHDKVVDFGWRALKQTTDKAKAIIQAFYGAVPHYSYFFGCSDGGREAMMEAQRFPDDFDGILAGAPANNWTHQFTGLAWDVQAAYDHTTLAELLPPAAIAVLSAGVRAQCAGHDGGLPSDKFLTDPRMCAVDWSKIQCKPGDPPGTCLTAAQVAAVQKIYAGPSNPAGPIYPGYTPDAEDALLSGWQLWITGPSLLPPFPTFGLGAFFGEGFFANFVYKVPLYNLMNVDMTTGLADADTLAPDLNAEDPDLTPFRSHGGKLIQYAGWADPAVSPLDGIDYYEAVRAKLGVSYKDQQDFYRLFLAPGMGHCSGGPGANAFGNAPDKPPPVADAAHDIFRALTLWRETGVKPDQVIATKYTLDNPALGVAFQRPLCPYPQLPRYSGFGPANLAKNWQCSARIPKP